jgi:glycosyltransferase involved in cell wall biosynthesis
MSTLFVSSYGAALGSGRAARTYGLLRALAVHGPVDFLHTDFEAPEPDAAHLALEGVRLHAVKGSVGPGRVVAFWRGRFSGVPAPVARGVRPELAAAAERLAAEPGCGRVIAGDPMAAVALEGLAKRRPVIYAAHNLESAFRQDWGRRAGKFEARLLANASETWLPSHAEVEAAAEFAPGAAARYVPNVVDVAAIEPRREPADPPEALLVADFTYWPNREGLRFLGRVMQSVFEQAPELRLSIAGRGLAEPPNPDPRVRILGFVDDLAPLYAKAACALVPLASGGGSPLKFVEALAHGVPVVSTPRGAAGLDAEPGRDYFEGDEVEGFAAAINAALDAERAAEVGAAGRALAEREYSIEALTALLAE